MGQKSEMYRMKPIFELPEKIDLPTCMYTMRNIINFKRNDVKYESNNEIADLIKDKKPLPELSNLEARWDSVLYQLNDLIKQVNSIKQHMCSLGPWKSSGCQFTLSSKALDGLRDIEGAVINANPSRPPYSIFLISQIFKNSITFTSHIHSSVNFIPDKLKSLCQTSRSEDAVKLFVIWKEDILDSELILNPVNQIAIKGEVNILRHLGRLGLDFLGYPLDDVCQTIQIDSILDMCHCLQHSQAAKEISSLHRNLNAKLGKNAYFGGENFSICDIAVWSTLKQIDYTKDLTPKMNNWFAKMDAMLPN